MKIKNLILIASLTTASTLVGAQAQQGLDPASIQKPLANAWPTYSGDYTGRRYSALTQVNRETVKTLTLSWVARVTAGPANGRGGRTIVGGEGTGEFNA